MIIQDIEKFIPYNEQEEKDKEEILRRLKNNEKLLTRDNKSAHLTASAWVLNQDHNKVLMAYHNLYDSWAWLGGHADGESDLLKVCIKEVKEESHIKDIKVLTPDIFSLEILTVDGHIKKGEYVSSHLHLNVTYLLEANDQQTLSIKEDENSNIGWFLLDDALKASSEPWFVDNIYSKLNEKVKLYDQKINR
ncbi:NUDIX hydrolase [Eggerthia catenaformis]|uniref:NUDIX hydrolase n=1 Tax=Eggerthia catenaformis TaxID=31973 RepID=UPI00248E3D37|nr:NUDIX hydrolase [Eggerthia catenaformis]